MVQFSSNVKVLTLNFTRDEMYFGLDSIPWASGDMMAFLQMFPSITTLHIVEALALPPPLLVCAPVDP